MKNQDIIRMPLPKESLIKRFSPIFEVFKRGQSATIIGLPYCGKGGFFKSIVETNKDIYNQMTSGYVFHFIFLDLYTGEKTLKNLRRYILERFTQNQPGNVKTTNITFSKIKNFVKNFKTNERLIFVIFGITEYSQESPEIIKVFKELYYLHFQPIAKICFLFPGDPMILNHPKLYEIQPLIQQNIFFFNALTNIEIEYTRKRLELIDNIKIDNTTHLKISQLSGNHYYLYKSIAKAYSLRNVELKLDDIKSNPQIRELLKNIYEKSISVLQKKENILNNHILIETGLVNSTGFLSPLFPIDVNDNFEQNTQLTPQELLVFEYLNENIKKIIPKEKLAKIIWGNNWPDQYSEQALDKLISRLKSKLEQTKFKITVVRKRGIRLTMK